MGVVGELQGPNTSQCCGRRRYSIYGISLHSEIALSLPEHQNTGLVDVELRTGSPGIFSKAIRGQELQNRSDWYHYAHLQDGSSYVRWSGVGEFLVSASGRRITCMRAREAPVESFQVYLLGQALSFALVNAGFEPLHATAIDVDGEAMVLLGDSGSGKSSLAASFLATGRALLTDDLMLVQPRASWFEAYPGPPRIKLFPAMARRFLGRAATGVPMNAETEKLVIPLGPLQSCQSPLPVRTIYALAPPHEARNLRCIRIEPLSQREAFLALLGNTFNYLVVHPSRLQRQVTETARLVNTIAVKKLSYPRLVSQLTSVREAILSDANNRASVGSGHDLI